MTAASIALEKGLNSIAHLRLIEVIHGCADKRISLTEAASQIGITTAGMTSAVDTLERKGLIRRADHPTDRRRYYLELTEEGHAFARSIATPQPPPSPAP